MNAEKEMLRVAAYPMDIVWADYKCNISDVDEVVENLPADTDLLVLPELFSTGFIQDEALLADIGEEATRLTIEAVKRWSVGYGICVCGSFLVSEAGKYFNRGFIAEPSGKITYYDKRHLFGLSAESGIYTAGKNLPPVIKYAGWNISMVICYDLRFPVWCRNDGQNYDILLIPANWAKARGYAFKHLLIARAIENQAYVVGCNRGGRDDYGEYDDESFIFNPFGYEMAPTDTTATKGIIKHDALVSPSNTVIECNSAGKKRNILVATFSKSQLHKTRSYLPVVRDADSFTIDIK